MKHLKYRIYTLAAVAILSVFSLSGYSQVNITGPVCVVPGTTYQYLISGNWDSTSTMQICLTGGSISGKAVSCTPTAKPVSYIQVSWQTATGGTIQVTSSSGNTSLAVTISGPLTGGSISDSGKSKSIAYNNVPATIHCSVSTGGSCSPKYSYQWQQSQDIVSWTNIAGAQSQDLALTSSYKQTMFFRRMVTEINSGSVAYSDAEAVNVGPPPPASKNKSKTVQVEIDDVAGNFSNTKIKNF